MLVDTLLFDSRLDSCCLVSEAFSFTLETHKKITWFSFGINLVVFLSKNICWFQLLKCEDLRIFFVTHDSKVGTYVFPTVGWTKPDIYIQQWMLTCLGTRCHQWCRAAAHPWSQEAAAPNPQLGKPEILHNTGQHNLIHSLGFLRALPFSDKYSWRSTGEEEEEEERRWGADTQQRAPSQSQHRCKGNKWSSLTKHETFLIWEVFDWDRRTDQKDWVSGHSETVSPLHSLSIRGRWQVDFFSTNILLSFSLDFDFLSI